MSALPWEGAHVDPRNVGSILGSQCLGSVSPLWACRVGGSHSFFRER